MSTVLAPRADDQISHRDGEGFCHYAHIECQLERPRALMACGLEREWFEMNAPDEMPKCVVCVETRQCRICGTLLTQPVD